MPEPQELETLLMRSKLQKVGSLFTGERGDGCVESTCSAGTLDSMGNWNTAVHLCSSVQKKYFVVLRKGRHI
jgi:hypothetical protein